MDNYDSHASRKRKVITDSHGRKQTFSLRLPDGSTFAGTRIDDESLYEAAVNNPIAHRITFGGARDTVNGWFTVVNLKGKKHTKDTKIQEKFQKTDMKKVLRKAYALARIHGRAWVIRRKDTDAETGYKYYGISNRDLASDFKNTWDEKGVLKPIGVRLKFTNETSIISVLIDPKDYIFFMFEQGEMDDKGIPILQPCWNDLVSIKDLSDSFRKRIQKYGGWAHITIMGANKTILLKAQDDWADFDEMSEAWSNEETEIEMKGLEGVALNPEAYYRPYIEQVAISTGWPSPILRGMESGQLKAGQINMSSFYAVISNYQDDLTLTAEGLCAWMEEGLSDFNVDWALEYSISDVDRLNMREISVRTAVALQPYITRKAFATEAGLEVSDVISEEEWNKAKEPKQNTFGVTGDQSENPLHKGKEDNIVTKDQGREEGEKLEKTLRKVK